MFQSLNSLGDGDMLAKLETMEMTINGLRDTQATISDFPELTALLSALLLSHRRLIKEALRFTAPRDSLCACSYPIVIFRCRPHEVAHLPWTSLLWRRISAPELQITSTVRSRMRKGSYRFKGWQGLQRHRSGAEKQI